MSLELRGSMLATQDNVPEAEKLFAAARREEKELGYHEPPFYIRPVAESEAAAMMTAGKWAEAEAAFQKALVDRPNSGFALYGLAQVKEKKGDVRCYHGVLPAVSQCVEDGGSGIAGDATCSAVGQPTCWGWQFRLLLTTRSLGSHPVRRDGWAGPGRCPAWTARTNQSRRDDG